MSSIRSVFNFVESKTLENHLVSKECHQALRVVHLLSAPRSSCLLPWGPTVCGTVPAGSGKGCVFFLFLGPGCWGKLLGKPMGRHHWFLWKCARAVPTTLTIPIQP